MALVGLLAAVGYMLFWPVPIEPVSWNAPKSMGYIGPHTQNSELSHLNLIDLGEESGPEHIAIGPDGWLYTGVNYGRILRFRPDGTELEIFARTGGRVLGIDFDASGNLIAADAHLGLLSVSPDGDVELLTDRAGDESFGFTDAVIVASDGRIFFTDASTRFRTLEWDPSGKLEHAANLDIIENSCTGRVLVYNPADRTTQVVARGLSFANGIVLTSDEQSVIVNETTKYRVWKLDVNAIELDLLSDPSGGELMFENLPGFPDNLTRGLDGRIWMGLAAPRVDILDNFSDHPLVRAMVLRLPGVLMPKAEQYGHVIAFNDDGEILFDLQDPSGVYPVTTGVTETADRLYIQNLNNSVLGWMKRP